MKDSCFFDFPRAKSIVVSGDIHGDFKSLGTENKSLGTENVIIFSVPIFFHIFSIVSIVLHGQLIYVSTYFYQIYLILRNAHSCIAKCGCNVAYKLAINGVYKNI